MPRLQTLKSGLQRIGHSIQTLHQTRNPEAEQRTRGRRWMKTREQWFIDHPQCAICGRVGVPFDLDHRIPLIDGGADDESNYQTLCRVPCHEEKTKEEAKARGRE